MNIFKKIEKIPRLGKVLLPTPLEKLQNISADCSQNIYVKHEELSGHSLGGNKERKLDFIIKEAITQGADTLLTLGAPQSNHCRMTAALGASNGLKVELIIISDNENFAQDEGNMMLNIMYGAKIRVVSGDKVQTAIDDIMKSAGNVYFIEGGGHCILGLLAYAEAALELKQQCDTIGITPETLVCPCGTGTTIAGIALGCALLNWSVNVVGISVARSANRCRKEIDSICQQGCIYLGITVPHLNYQIYDNYIGEGYGVVSKESFDTLMKVASLDALILDPVYNAKTMTGLLSELKNGNITGPLVYWNTGGQPALFINKYSNMLVTKTGWYSG